MTGSSLASTLLSLQMDRFTVMDMRPASELEAQRLVQKSVRKAYRDARAQRTNRVKPRVTETPASEQRQLQRQQEEQEQQRRQGQEMVANAKHPLYSGRVLRRHL